MILSNDFPCHDRPDALSSDSDERYNSKFLKKLGFLLIVSFGSLVVECSALSGAHEPSCDHDPHGLSWSRSITTFCCIQGKMRPSASGFFTRTSLKPLMRRQSWSFPPMVLVASATKTNKEHSELPEQPHAMIIDTGRSALRFKASLAYTTEPVPLLPTTSESTEVLENFFTSTKHRNHLLIGTGNINVDSGGEASPALVTRWKNESSLVGTVPPSPHDQIIRLKVSTNFLVFTIHVIATLGTKLIVRRRKSVSSGETDAYHATIIHHNIASLEHQFTLLKEEFYAEGPAPLVWIFDQITAGIRGPINDEVLNLRPHTNHGSHKVWTEEIVPDNNAQNKSSSMVFKSLTTVEITIMFPSLLLKILPVAKEIIEEQGSKSLQKSMERDVLPGLFKFRDSYLQWVESY